MGGNLWENSSRVNREEYLQLSSEIIHILNLAGREAVLPPCFKKKSDFGDIDIVVKGAALTNEEILSLWREIEISRNSNVISILYRGCQVDLNFQDEHFDTSVQYYSWNDAPNFLGRVAKKLGLSLGHYGLALHIRLSEEDSCGKIIVSKDWSAIVDFLGFDAAKWNDGFDDALDLYQWISSSKYFNKELFSYENLTHKTRVRDRKRPVYHGFIEWCKDKDFDINYECKNKVEHLFRAMLHFGCDFFDAAKPLIDNRRRKLAVREIFSGSDILPLGFAGKDLGRKIEGFKLQFEDWEETVLASTKEKMIEKFLQFEKSGVI